MCVIRSFREQITHASLIQVNNTSFGMDGRSLVAALCHCLRHWEAHILVNFSSYNLCMQWIPIRLKLTKYSVTPCRAFSSIWLRLRALSGTLRVATKKSCVSETLILLLNEGVTAMWSSLLRCSPHKWTVTREGLTILYWIKIDTWPDCLLFNWCTLSV